MKTLISPGGHYVYAGENANENEYLTFQFAQTESDLWFHSRDVPGSHVLLRRATCACAAMLNAIDLQFAADVAAYYSKSRKKQSVPIMYCPVAKVYKPKGAPPGTVEVRGRDKIITGVPANRFSNVNLG